MPCSPSPTSVARKRRRIREFYFHDAELVFGVAALFGLEEVEFACGGFGDFDDSAESIFILASPFEPNSDLISLYAMVGCEVNVAQAALGLATPDERFSGIDFKRIAA